MKRAYPIICGLLVLAMPVFTFGPAVRPLAVQARPQPSPSPSSASDDGAATYAKYTSGATGQHGLFTIWRKNGDIGIELQANQLGVDYIETGIPINGVGQSIFSGTTDLQPVRIIRFVRQDDKVAILFPSTRFYAKPGTPQAISVDMATAPTVVGVAKIVAENKATGAVVIDASSFLQDITGVADALNDLNSSAGPGGEYRLDSTRSFFTQTKAFPENVILSVAQTFSTSRVGDSEGLSVSPDARNLQIQLQYNIAAIPHDNYMPRLADDRIGYFINAHMDFTHDISTNKDMNYIVRWNLQPSDPSKRVSPATKPIVYYLSNTIPYRYRAPIRSALLEWNKAFEKIGISNAIEVRDQPNDPNFDPDDIRYNVIRWLAEVNGGFAEAQLLYNPYTGEMVKAGVVVDSDLMRFANFEYPSYVAPETKKGTASTFLGGGSGDDDFLSNERMNFGFGLTALELSGGTAASGDYYVPQKYADEFLEAIVLHESGHDFGLRHNFMGSDAYTAKQLKSKAFTSRYGVSTSVMEYSPVNLWPKGTSTGDYYQTVLGPYDYYAIQWGYAAIPGARSPQDEVHTLDRWLGAGSTATYQFSSDEDVMWNEGAGVDPRNQQWDLTNDNIAWCGTQMGMARDMLHTIDQRFPRVQAPYDDLRSAFEYVAGVHSRCSQIVSRYIGGEYLSRTLRGDPHAKLPLSPIPLATEKRAFAVLRNNLFSTDAWNLSPALLRQLVTQYRGDDWLGNAPPRHDIAIETLAAKAQAATIDRLFTPVMLQRFDDMDLKYSSGTTMDVGDLFSWMQSAVFGDTGSTASGDIASGKAIPLIRRNLQRAYAAKLAFLANIPGGAATGDVPPDAQALARYELGDLRHAIRRALGRGVPDLVTRAHLEALDADAQRALDVHGGSSGLSLSF